MTRWSSLGRWQAIGILALAGGFMLLLLAVAATAPVSPENISSAGDGDLALFRRIVAEMQGGASYYAAAHHQLVTSGYGTQSVFNWRLPGLAFILSVLPSLDIGQWMLIAIAVLAGNVMVWVLNQQGGSRLAALGAVVMLLSLAGAFTPGTVLLSELVAGIFVLLSVALYGSGFRRAGLAAGAAALFAREFASIYILVCIWLAWRAKRWRELSAWAAVLLVYGAYFLWHYGQVQLHVTAADRGYAEDWIQFGGLSFVLATSAFNGFFALLPTPAHAVLLPITLLGLLAWPGETGARASLTVLAVIIVFAVVGKPFNTYWGLIYTPLLSLGLAWAPWAVADLMHGALGRRRNQPQMT